MDVGYQVFDAVGYVGGSAIPVVIYGVNMKANGSGSISLQEESGGTEVLQHGFVKDECTITFPYGLTFPNGCYIGDPGDGQFTVFYQTLK